MQVKLVETSMQKQRLESFDGALYIKLISTALYQYSPYSYNEITISSFGID